MDKLDIDDSEGIYGLRAQKVGSGEIELVFTDGSRSIDRRSLDIASSDSLYEWLGRALGKE